MMWLRKHWYLPIAALLVVAGVRVGCRSFNRPSAGHVPPATESAAESTYQPQPGAYNFTRMIALLERTQAVRRRFKEQFRGYPSRHIKPIDMNETRDLLADLYRERVRLSKYFLAVKAQYKGQIPEKRRKALVYYQGVVDECISDIEKILRKV